MFINLLALAFLLVTTIISRNNYRRVAVVCSSLTEARQWVYWFFMALSFVIAYYMLVALFSGHWAALFYMILAGSINSAAMSTAFGKAGFQKMAEVIAAEFTV